MIISEDEGFKELVELVKLAQGRMRLNEIFEMKRNWTSASFAETFERNTKKKGL